MTVIDRRISDGGAAGAALNKEGKSEHAQTACGDGLWRTRARGLGSPDREPVVVMKLRSPEALRIFGSQETRSS
jgi:hypothetical protein